MGKLIFFLFIGIIIYFLFFNKKGIKHHPKKEDNIENKELILCDNCKTFTPEEEIIKIDNKNICKECYDNFKWAF